MRRLSVWIGALWWGSLATLACLVVPLLFAHLPTPAMAGHLAAKLFTAQTWVSVACALLLLLISTRKELDVLDEYAYSAIIYIVGGMLLALLSEFAVAPKIVARENLKLWHSVGSVMYLVQWLCAGMTFWKLLSYHQASHHGHG